MILRAAGMSAGQGGKTGPKAKQTERARKADPARRREETAGKQDDPARPQGEAKTKQGPGPAMPRTRPEGMVPLFVSMGKRQRLRPQELRALIAEKLHLAQEELGRVHLFDNYSFIDVPERKPKIVRPRGHHPQTQAAGNKTREKEGRRP